jgi:hypothetical protein
MGCILQDAKQLKPSKVAEIQHVIWDIQEAETEIDQRCKPKLPPHHRSMLTKKTIAATAWQVCSYMPGLNACVHSMHI